jgi:hypothetical protein
MGADAGRGSAGFMKKGIHVAPGTSFDNLSDAWVRINTPVSAREFISRLDCSGRLAQERRHRLPAEFSSTG